MFVLSVLQQEAHKHRRASGECVQVCSSLFVTHVAGGFNAFSVSESTRLARYL